MPLDRSSFSPDRKPDWFSALRRGFRGTCPVCGTGRLFSGYVKLKPACAHCATALEPHRADDAPAYFTIFLVGHLVIPAMLMLERMAQPAIWIHWALWLPLTVLLSLIFLPRIKGAVVGLQWALGIRRDEVS